MTVTDARRLALFDQARSAWGEPAAQTLMDLLPSDPSRLATSHDLALHSADLRAEMADVRTEMADVRAGMADVRTEMADLRTELKTEMADLRTELKTEMADVRTELGTSIGALRAEMKADFADLTRTLVLAMVGTMLTGVSLAFVAARFG